MMKIIEVRNIHFYYGNIKALENVSMVIKKGDSIGLIGDNGSGKSTLLRILNGILIPNKGELYFNGKKIDFENREEIIELRKNVGYVFQNPENQIVGVTVEEDIAFGLENIGIPRKEMKERINWVLETVELKGFERKDPNLLSGGQKQRLAIASILAMKPKVLLLDEPTSMLDPKGRCEVYEILKKLKNMGITIILASHHAQDMNLVDKIIYLKKGKIVFEGKKTDFYLWAYKNNVIVEYPFEFEAKYIWKIKESFC